MNALPLLASFSLAAMMSASTAFAARPPAPAAFALAGAWTLVAADVIHPDGTRGRDYGEAPKGLLLIEADGRYSLQIFKSERPKFASPDKARGAAGEFAAAVLGSSTHYGRIIDDRAAGVLIFSIEGSSFPNWEGTQQKRAYALKGDTLSYQVAPRLDGSIPISEWRRLPADGPLRAR